MRHVFTYRIESNDVYALSGVFKLTRYGKYGIFSKGFYFDREGVIEAINHGCLDDFFERQVLYYRDWESET